MIPHDEEQERAVIGIALVDQAIPFAAKELSTPDFYVPANRAAWAAIVELDEERLPIDEFAVFERMQSSSWPLKRSELMQMTMGIPSESDASKEVQRLQRLTTLRSLHSSFSDLADKAAKQESIDALVEKADAVIAAVREAQAVRKGTSAALAEVYEREVIPRIDKFVAGEIVKVPFGWSQLDWSTNGGAAPGELVILGAKPKSGKSGIMLQIARQQAERGLACYICSREMLNYENGFRMLAQTSEYTANNFRSGMFQSVADRIKAHAVATGGLPMHFDDKAKTVRDIRKELIRLEGQGLKITSAFVDYVQLMRSPSRSTNKADVMEEIIYDLKDLATEREIVVYANAQFNREGIEAEKPTMAHFKHSSAIEMAGNLVLLWTLEKQPREGYKARHGDLWIEAGRNVATDEFKILFHGDKSLFEFL